MESVNALPLKPDGTVMAGRKHARLLAQLAIEVPALGARAHPGALAARIDADLLQLGNVDQHDGVAQVRGGPAVTAGAHRDLQPALTRDLHRGHDILRLLGLHDGGGIARRSVRAPCRSAARRLVRRIAAPQ